MELIEMEKITNLNELVQQAREHLVSLEYKDYGILQYGRIWHLLVQYADARNIKIYSTELGCDFLEHHYGVAVGRTGKEKDRPCKKQSDTNTIRLPIKRRNY